MTARGADRPRRAGRAHRRGWAARAVAATLVLAAASGLPVSSSWAGTTGGSVFAWRLAGDGLWTDPSAWRLVSGPLGAGYPDGAGDTAQFPATGAAAVTVTVPDGVHVTAGTVTFTGGEAYRITAGGPTAGLVLAGQAQVTGQPVTDAIALPVTLAAPLTTSVAAPAVLSFEGPVGERRPAGVTNTGTGVLRLAATNAFSGGLTAVAGTVVAAADDALGTGTLTLDAGTAVRGEGAPHTLSAPVVLSGDNGQAITFSGADLAFTSPDSTVTMPTKLDVENRTSFARLLDGKSGQRSLRVTGAGTLALGAAGPGNVGYAGGSVQSTGPAGLEVTGTGAIGALGWAGGSGGLLDVAGPGATGQLTTAGNVTFGPAMTFAVDLDGTSAGSGYDQLDTSTSGGNVTLGNASLAASLGPATAVGDSFTVVRSGGAVTGRFADLAGNGCTVDGGAGPVRVDYQPASVVLTRVAAAQDRTLGIGGFPTQVNVGTTGAFTVTATDCRGTVDPGYTGTVTFSSSDPKAVLPPPYTFTAADAGRHTFAATFRTAGVQDLTATDLVAGIPATQTGITVTPSSADVALRAGQPGTTYAVGARVTTTFTLTNNGPGSADGVTVAVTSSAGAVVTQAVATAGRYAAAGDTWTLTSLPPHGSATLQVTTFLAAPGSQTVTVAKTGQYDPDPVAGNDTAIATFTVRATGGTPAGTPGTTSGGTVVTPPEGGPAPASTPAAPAAGPSGAPGASGAAPQLSAGGPGSPAAPAGSPPASKPGAGASTPAPSGGGLASPPADGQSAGTGSPYAGATAPWPVGSAPAGVAGTGSGGGGASAAGSGGPPAAGHAAGVATRLGRVAKAVVHGAVAVVRGAAFPLLSLLPLLLFVVVQNEIDRRDPKLAASPLFAEPDLDFE